MPSLLYLPSLFLTLIFRDYRGYILFDKRRVSDVAVRGSVRPPMFRHMGGHLVIPVCALSHSSEQIAQYVKYRPLPEGVPYYGEMLHIVSVLLKHHLSFLPWLGRNNSGDNLWRFVFTNGHCPPFKGFYFNSSLGGYYPNFTSVRAIRRPIWPCSVIVLLL